MKLTYLGTAAAEGWPALFCRCAYCQKALEKGGRNLRTRSQAMVGDDLLIDFPADSFSHMQQNGLNFSAVKYLLITHSHMDHFSPTDLHLRSTSYYAHDLTSETLDLYGNERVCEFLSRERVARSEEPNDTGLLADEVYDYLAKNKVRADLVSYDCTFVSLPSGGGHLGLDSCPAVRKRLEEIGVSDAHTVSVVNHFSHNGGLIYDELVPVAAKDGFLTSYDGMVVEF